MTLTACGGGRSASGGDNADLNVTQVGPATVAAGSPATFTALVVNTGRSDAINLVIAETLTPGYTSTVTCVASFGALCPTTLGPTMSLPTLGPGRSLTFTFVVDVPPASRGDIVHQVQATSTFDTDLSDNSATVTAVAIDGRNGDYTAYAANGKFYDLTIDFDALNYTMTVDGAPQKKTFAAGIGEYIVGGTQRLRTATDLVIGNHDFGSGQLVPYIAARKFGTTLVDGSFNLATRNLAADGTASTHAGTARLSGNVLSICQTDTSVQPTQNCPVVLTSYLLSVAGDIYTGIDTSSGAAFTFQLARSGAIDRPPQRPGRARRHAAAPGRSAGVGRPRVGNAVRSDSSRCSRPLDRRPRLGDDGARRCQRFLRRARRHHQRPGRAAAHLQHRPVRDDGRQAPQRQRRHLRAADAAAGDRDRRLRRHRQRHVPGGGAMNAAGPGARRGRA